uniref:Variant erythrocyte surface antigen-1, beta subunit n=1 Tax=Babesia bovis TaxID=5865 RepID=A7ATC6_BABBO|eukprot:XP_001609755.1 variant erythrocyte surface antigen-1, beta subunit [Babesia bovis T2Bo]
MAKQWPYDSLTKAPTNLKEAIDWVLRVTGKDGKKNEAAAKPQLGCLCFLAKAVKDLLYDARSPGSPGPSTQRYWNDLLLEQESTIAQPVLEDLGLLSTGSGTVSTTYTCAGGTEVIKTLIDQLALGLQKWVGWKEEKGKDVCCLKGESGIGKKCTCSGGAGQCCTGSSNTPCHECEKCGTSASRADNKCYLSAYCKKKPSSGSSSPTDLFLWTSISSESTRVHLLARIFLGSVCLIWSGLSQLGFLTGGDNRWETSKLHDISGDSAGLGSFMAAMGYDLDRLNQEGNTGKKGEFVWKLLSGTDPNGSKGIQWQEFASVKGANQSSVAEYYSSIYTTAQSADKSNKTEEICKDYPLLVLHILASGYFRAGSAGAKGITSPAKPATGDPRKPRTIREILYWLSALPYSQGYRALVERMGDKTDQVTQGNSEDKKGQIELYDTSAAKASTSLKRNDITHYLMAACGYCPLVLIGIQGTIEKEVGKPAQGLYRGARGATVSLRVVMWSHGVVGVPGVGVPGAVSPAAAAKATAEKNRCPKHIKDPKSKRCTLEDAAKAATQAPAPPSASTGQQLKPGQVCYGGYHLEVSKFGPLHGMYANGLFGFDMGGSPAQCLDQLRIYVYHCFYQLYFLRKQCGAGVDTAGTTVLGWKSCRYGYQVSTRKGGNTGGADNKQWQCKPLGVVIWTYVVVGGGGNSNGNNQGGSPNQNNPQSGGNSNGNKDMCNCMGQGAIQGGHGSSGDGSPLQSFLCDSINGMHCHYTVGSGVEKYPEIDAHMNKTVDSEGKEHEPHKKYPELCPVPMGWSKDKDDNHFKGTSAAQKYPAHCTGRTLFYLLEYYCDPDKCQSGTLVVLLRLLACITLTVPRTLGDLFGFYYYIVYIGGSGSTGGGEGVKRKLQAELQDVRLSMLGNGGTTDAVVGALIPVEW